MEDVGIVVDDLAAATAFFSSGACASGASKAEHPSTWQVPVPEAIPNGEPVFVHAPLLLYEIGNPDVLVASTVKVFE
jgi:hypothetical protein